MEKLADKGDFEQALRRSNAEHFDGGTEEMSCLEYYWRAKTGNYSPLSR